MGISGANPRNISFFLKGGKLAFIFAQISPVKRLGALGELRVLKSLIKVHHTIEVPLRLACPFSSGVACGKTISHGLGEFVGEQLGQFARLHN